VVEDDTFDYAEISHNNDRSAVNSENTIECTFKKFFANFTTNSSSSWKTWITGLV